MAQFTKEEVLTAMAAGKMKPADALKMLEAIEQVAVSAARSGGNKRTISTNKSGGLFVSDPGFKCYSTAKSKDYQGSFNMDAKVAKVLFGKQADTALVSAIGQFVDSM